MFFSNSTLLPAWEPALKTKEYYKAKAAQKDLADIGNKLYENEKKLVEAAK